MSPWKVILATMVIFACGVITGAMLTGTMPRRAGRAPAAAGSTRPRNPAEAILQMQRALDKQFDLTAGQREEIGRILKASQERTQPLWDKIAPQMTDELKKTREEIRGALTPEQWKKFMELMKRKRKGESAPPGAGRSPRPAESAAPATNAP